MESLRNRAATIAKRKMRMMQKIQQIQTRVTTTKELSCILLYRDFKRMAVWQLLSFSCESQTQRRCAASNLLLCSSLMDSSILFHLLTSPRVCLLKFPLSLSTSTGTSSHPVFTPLFSAAHSSHETPPFRLPTHPFD